jgi:hypothetical protein
VRQCQATYSCARLQIAHFTLGLSVTMVCSCTPNLKSLPIATHSFPAIATMADPLYEKMDMLLQTACLQRASLCLIWLQ